MRPKLQLTCRKVPLISESFTPIGRIAWLIGTRPPIMIGSVSLTCQKLRLVSRKVSLMSEDPARISGVCLLISRH